MPLDSATSWPCSMLALPASSSRHAAAGAGRRRKHGAAALPVSTAACAHESLIFNGCPTAAGVFRSKATAAVDGLVRATPCCCPAQHLHELACLCHTLVRSKCLRQALALRQQLTKCNLCKCSHWLAVVKQSQMKQCSHVYCSCAPLCPTLKGLLSNALASAFTGTRSRLQLHMQLMFVRSATWI